MEPEHDERIRPVTTWINVGVDVVPDDRSQVEGIPKPEDLRHALAKSGHRLTGQRRFIYEAVRRFNGHPNAEEVYRLVRQRAPKVSLATVYNGLEALVAAGELGKLPRAGVMPARYELRKDVHHHARCVDCDMVWDLDPPADPLPVGQLLGHHRFKPLDARVEVIVECPIKTNTPLGSVPNAVCPIARSNRFKQRADKKRLQGG